MYVVYIRAREDGVFLVMHLNIAVFMKQQNNEDTKCPRLPDKGDFPCYASKYRGFYVATK